MKMNPGIAHQPFTIKFSSEWFTKNDILSSGNSAQMKILKNHDKFNRGKSKEWKKILRKLKVKVQTGYKVEMI